MIRNFKYMEKVLLINHSAKWIMDSYCNKPVFLKSKFKDSKGQTWINFTVDGLSVMMGKPSWFKKIK